MEFLKIDPRLDEHPDVIEAGFAGSTVFQAILRACASFDKRGRLPSKFSALWLARRMGLTAEDSSLPPETFVRLGIDRCVKAGLLLQDGGELVIPGWERFYTAPLSGAERMQSYRERQRKQSEPTPQQDEVTTVTDVRHSDATPQDYTRHHKTIQIEAMSAEPDGSTDSAQLKLLVQGPEPEDPRSGGVFEHWRQVFGKGPGAKFSKERKRAVVARLKEGYSVEQLCTAIDGCSRTPHNMGVNEQGQRYDDLELICRTGSQVERFTQNASLPPVVAKRKLTDREKLAAMMTRGAP